MLRAVRDFFLSTSPVLVSAPGVPIGALLASRADEVETGQWARRCLSELLKKASEFGAPPAETEGSEGTRARRGHQPLARWAAHLKALIKNSQQLVSTNKHGLTPVLAAFKRLAAYTKALFPALLFASTFTAHAQLRFEITGVGAKQLPIAVASFKGDASPFSVADIVRADLTRSGLFRLLEAGNAALDETSSIVAADWRARGADALVVGSVEALADGRYDVRFRLHDISRGTPLLGLSYTPTRDQLRLTAHRISDAIFEKLIGDKGVFSTRIAYILKRGSRYSLQVADADGANAQEAFGSNEPIISPKWSPDGKQLAYVSFESRKPVVYVHDVASGKRRMVANYRGSNSAPAWSPDGRTLAVALTTSGIQQIYLISADGSGTPRRLTRSSGIDTEPSFSPDGQWVYFVSDRGGGAQIYRVDVNSGNTERVTFSGEYNVSPRLSPDGKQLTYITRRGGRFQTALLDLSTRQEMVLTPSSQDESPSFAPNGRYLLYATVENGRDVLGVVSTDGQTRTRLSVAAGDVREPAWGPFF